MSLNYDGRIVAANSILNTFVPGVVLYQGERELWMSWGRVGPRFRTFPARLRGEGDIPQYGYRQRPCGGTGMQALAQIIRYVRDLPRLPMDTWEYWVSSTVQLGSIDTLTLLRAAGYDHPSKTRCVLCKGPYKRGIDWWSKDGVTGPCCFGGLCTPDA
jgi:hypothetical protein